MNLYSASKEYRNALDDEKCKKDGIYYTPEAIVKLMVEELFREVDISDNIKILDIASGCGLFFSEIIEYFSKKADEKSEEYIEKVISESLYAIEKDGGSVEILKNYITGKYEASADINRNVFADDALFPKNRFIKNGMFDYIIGNPPYVGHKNIDGEYAKKLRNEFKDIYVNKSDLYYCFFKKAMDYLKDGGVCSFIVPRYFLESQSALGVRNFLEKNAEILNIFDFRNCDVFSKNIGITPCIITFRKRSRLFDSSDEKNMKIKIIQDKEDLDYLLSGNNTNSDGVLFKDDTSWAVITEKEKKIMDSIKKKEIYKLGDIVDSYQGVITGCDKAFILKEDSELLKDIDLGICKRWIKSKNIKSYNIEESDKVLLYTDSLATLENSGLKNHLLEYEDKLDNRREVLRGIRKWYHLQWGRQENIFEQEKIVYPFKSKNNRFALDRDNSFFSADVYFFTIKDEFKEKISYEYLLTLLNSGIYETYMHAFLKKMGNSVYEYYPYRLLETYIFIDENYKIIENMGKLILNEKNKSEKEQIMKKIDKTIEKSLKLTDFNKK